MNRKNTKSWIRILFFGAFFCAGSVLGQTVASLPEEMNFQSGELPHDEYHPAGFPYFFGYWTRVPWSFTTNGTARTQIVADSSRLETFDLAGTGVFLTASSRVKGAYYYCDTMAVLNSQSIELGRSASTEVTFVVYESTTSNGTYSVISSNVVTALVGTNVVSSGEISVPFKAGRYYLVAAGWDNASTYTYQSSASYPQTTTFGRAFQGYSLNSYPPSSSVSNSMTSSLYFQTLKFSTNAVVRMDSASAGTYATNSMDLAVDLSGYTDVTLTFRYRDSSDEDDSSDGIFLSNDSGTNFTRVESL